MDTSTWVDPDRPGWIIRPQSEQDWTELANEYGARAPTPFIRTLEAARAAGCRSVVVENRYVDPDYRSEFSAFWSQRFEDTPAFARRLHFFGTDVREQALHRIGAESRYLGYAVIRPLPFGPLGRTMLVPPPRVAGATLALAPDDVTLFGNKLHIDAAPFCQQDGEFLRCAHAAAWMCHYAAARRGMVGRHRTGALVEATPTMLSAERALPSKGMTLLQLQAVFESFEQPALFYGLGQLPSVRGVEDPTPATDGAGQELPAGKWDTRVFSIVCRYLNSGYPVFIATQDHAFVVIGWYREGEMIRFVVNDDQRGPYQIVDSPFDDERGTWQAIMVPLPPRVFLSGEAAESEAHRTFRALGSDASAPDSWRIIAAGVANKSVSLRTVLRDANEFKIDLDARQVDEDVVRLVRLARLPHYVWVVEAHDRTKRENGEPCVLAEAIFDSTSSDYVPRLDVLLMPSMAMAYPPEPGSPEAAETTRNSWASSLPMRVPELPAQIRPAV